VIANQAGNGNYAAAAQVTETTTAILATSSTAVSSSANPSVYSQPVTLTATISGQYGQVKGRKGQAKPQNLSGTVTWSGNTGCGTTTVTSGTPGTATCTTSSLAVGTDAITATYSGDSNHNGNSSTLSGGQVVSQASTNATVGSSLNPSTYGQAVSFTANVAAVAPAGGTPTGTVQFTVDGVNVGSPVTLASGSATSSSTSTLAEGTHTDHGGVLGRDGLRGQHGNAERRADGQSGDGSDGGDFERESVDLGAVGNVDGDDQRTVWTGEGTEGTDKIAERNRDGGVERQYGMQRVDGDVGQSGNGDVHDLDAPSGDRWNHGDVLGRQQPRREHGNVEWRRGRQSGDSVYDHDGWFQF
jgi:hypothetical protein